MMIAVKLNGYLYSGWQEATVTRSIERAVSSFSLVLTDYNDNGINLLESKPGDLIEILIDDTLVITGYIDTFQIGGDATTHGIQISGRSKTKDLTDCSTTKTQQFKNMTLFQLVTVYASEYNIDVIIDSPMKDEIITEFQTQQDGESPFQAIQRIAERYKLLITDTRKGELLLTNVGSTKSNNTIIRGQTKILSYDRTRTENERYQKIVVKAQTRSTDNFYGKQANQTIAERIDPDVRRNKTKIIIADSSLSQTEAFNRANWESQAAAGKADTIQYSIQGWYGNEELWQDNQLLNINDPYINVDGDYVIATVEYSISDAGSISTLTLNPPEAFEQEPESTKQRNKKDKNKPKELTKQDFIDNIIL